MASSHTYGILKGVSSNVQNERYRLATVEVLIGRGTACQIQLKDPKVSRQHARIRFHQGVVTIEDLKSAHGTLVNGVQVTSAQLRGGEELTLGDTRFRFDLVAVAAPTPQPVAPVPVPQPAVAQVAQPAVPPSTPDTPKSRRWLPFLAGLAIPFILGIVGVAALLVLGFFDDPDELPDVRQAMPTIEATASEQAETVPFTLRPYDPATDSNLPLQSNLAVYDDEGTDSGYLYELPLVVGQEVILDYFYCGTSEAILEEISGSILVSFEINGETVADEFKHVEKMVRDTRACYTTSVIFQAHSPGEHVYVQTMTATEQINDGWETWGPEELVTRILIRVEGDATAPLEPTQPVLSTSQPVEPTIGVSQPSEPTLTLHIGDARMFSTPPEVIAYANTQASPAPPEIAIDEDCGEDCFRFNEWIGFRGANQWIEGYATVPTTAIGVQFWGDANDGLARVYLNGTEIWSGDTRGEDNQWPGGAFVRYLEISGLPEDNHSLIVESLGEGGAVTLYFFGIGAVIP